MAKQLTIKKELKIRGKRQGDGSNTFVKFIPGKDGLKARYKKKTVNLDPNVINYDETRSTNSIIINNEVIPTIEHIFSAINGLQIDNLIIEFGSNEPPFFPDSKKVAKKLSENLIEIDNTIKKTLTIDREIRIDGDYDQYCVIKPSDSFSVDATIDFNNIIGLQKYTYDQNSDYLRDISFARSFLINELSLKNDNPWDRNLGYIDLFPAVMSKNPRRSPFLVYTESEFITPLKDPLEPVKHKVLDFIGDLIFINSVPLGHFELYKPGHALNRKIVKKINELYNI